MMKNSSLTCPGRLAPVTLALSLLATLAACGGGGSTDTPTTDVSQDVAQSASVNTAVIPNDTTEAMTTSLSTLQATLAGTPNSQPAHAEGMESALSVAAATGQFSQTVNCPGGGTAAFTATGASAIALANGQFDAGEHYAVTFTGCKRATGAASVDGSMTLDVISASGSDFAINTATTNVVVTLPQRTITLNGSSSLTRTVVTAGSTTTTTNHWVTPSYTAVTASATRTSTFSLTNVDLTRTITVTNGVVTASSSTGSSTLTASLPKGSFSITLASQGAVSYDASGVPTNGSWAITLPHNVITFTVAGGIGTVAIDHGADGTIDKTYTFTIAQLMADAG